MTEIKSTYRPTLREFLSLMLETNQIITMYASNEDMESCDDFFEISEDLCFPLEGLGALDEADIYEINGHSFAVPVSSKKLFDFLLDKKISFFVLNCPDDTNILPNLCIYFDIDDSTPYSVVREWFELEKESFRKLYGKSGESVNETCKY